MASGAGDVFTKWINSKLRELNTDESVFSAYIIAILEGDESPDEQKEALEEILSQIIESDINSLIDEIKCKWEESRPKCEEPKKVFEDVDTKLAKLLESKCIPAQVQRQQYTPDELRIREQILAQYSQVELDECDDDDETGISGSATGSGAVTGNIGSGVSGGGSGSASGSSSGSNIEKKNDPLLIKNTNAQDVAQLAKERREQAKLESKAKKDKDKEDREKQKQLREEKKEKRRTVKGERRR